MNLRRMLALPVLLLMLSCGQSDLFEKTASVPRQAWSSSFKPSFTFDITDTAAGYNVFLVLRHTDQYSFNNIWLKITVKIPGQPEAKTFMTQLVLATNEKGWLATGMDDIYEHLADLKNTLVENDISFRRKGRYEFTIEQVMREDPLKHVMNVGLRVETIK